MELIDQQSETIVRSDKARYDIDLVNRAVAGDERAYAELLSRYRDSIYFMLLKMVKNPDDADDLTMEAFGKAFRSIKQYSPNFAFSTWLFKIASNNGIDFMRKRMNERKENIVSIDNMGGEEEERRPVTVISDELDPSENMIKAQKEALVRDVVSKLKPRYRTLVEMRYFQELSYEEISDKLNLPLGTVKAQLFRSRELLYNILKDTDTAEDRL